MPASVLIMERNILSVRHLLIAFFLPVFVNACSGPLEEPLRVGSNIWPGYENLFLARSLKLYPPRTVHLAELPSTTAVLHELNAGTIDAACLTLDETLSARARGLDLKVLLVMDISAGGDVLLSDPSLTALNDLRGKTIAVENTTVGAILLDGALQAGELKAADVVLKFASADEHEKVYRSGEVDAVVTYEPIRSRLLGEGARELFNSSQMMDLIVDVLVAPGAVTETHAAQLRALIKGHFDALDYRRRHPIDADRRMAPRLGVTLDEVTEMFKGMRIPDLAENRRLLEGSPPALEETAQKLIPNMQRANLLRDAVTVTDMIDPRFLPSERQRRAQY